MIISVILLCYISKRNNDDIFEERGDTYYEIDPKDVHFDRYVL